MGMKDLSSGLFIFVFCIFIALSSMKQGLGTGDMPGPGFLPFLSAITLLILSLLLIVISFKKKLISEAPKEKIRYRKVIFIIFALLGYSLLLDILGFYSITFILIVVLILIESRKSFGLAIMVGSLTAVSVYIVFEFLLGVHFPKGVFVSWVK
jgi:hypothetical protein